MAEIIRFDLNIPQTVTLKYAGGKEVEGRYGNQFMYSLADGRVMYVDPDVAAKITEQAIAPGQPFAICKREIKQGRSRRIEWQVVRVEDAGQTGQIGQAERGAPPARAAAPSATTRTADANSTAPRSSTIASQMMGSALVAAIDSLLIAEQYGKKQGMELQFEEEDVRAVAATLFIQFCKASAVMQGASAAESGYVNGGTTWPQQ